MCKTDRDKNRFVDYHTQYGMETFKRDIPFLLPEMPTRVLPA